MVGTKKSVLVVLNVENLCRGRLHLCHSRFSFDKKIDIVLGQKIKLDQLDCGLKIAGSF